MTTLRSWAFNKTQETSANFFKSGKKSVSTSAGLLLKTTVLAVSAIGARAEDNSNEDGVAKIGFGLTLLLGLSMCVAVCCRCLSRSTLTTASDDYAKMPEEKEVRLNVRS